MANMDEKKAVNEYSGEVSRTPDESLESVVGGGCDPDFFQGIRQCGKPVGAEEKPQPDPTKLPAGKPGPIARP